jgi:hypothetical protein
MKYTLLFIAICAGSTIATAQQKSDQPVKYFIDVHNVAPGKVSYEQVQAAHQKDLATEDKFGVKFIKYWIDEEQGKIYCLSTAPEAASVNNTHKMAHGLVYDNISEVTPGWEDLPKEGKQYYLDVHELGAGKVTAAAVAEAHKKDLAVQGSHDVNFINYWVDEKNGLVYCLSQAPSANAVVETHKEAHGLLPAKIYKVKQGQ